MATYTTRDLLRIYSAGIGKGTNDADLTPRQRRLALVLVNIASNCDAGTYDYPPTTAQRESIVRYLSDISWNGGRALVDATGPASADAYSIAYERALEIIRAI